MEIVIQRFTKRWFDYTGKPRFEDNERIIYVDTPDELKPNEEIMVNPKIVEE